MKKALSLAVLALFLAACAQQPNTAPFLVDYSGLGKIPLNVGSVNIVDRSGGPLTEAPYVDSQFRPSIMEALRRWVKDRLVAQGTSGEAAFIVKEANVVGEALPTNSGWFTREQGTKYTAHAVVEIDAKGPTAYALATAEASRSVTLIEDPSQEEKQAAWHTLLDGLMADLNRNLEDSIHAHMGSFLVGP